MAGLRFPWGTASRPAGRPTAASCYNLGASDGPPETVIRVTVDVIDGDQPSLDVGTPEHLFDYQYHVVLGGRRHHDVSSDGQRFLMITRGDSDTVGTGNEINVVLNWHQELLERVPIP